MSINKVILLGNVGKEPEIRNIDNNVKVASFTLATTDRAYKTQSGAVVPERTEWHNIIAWRGLADIVERYVHKGTPLYVEGKLRTRSWDDQNGNKRYVTEIYAENIELLGRRQDNQNQQQNQQAQSQEGVQNQFNNYQQPAQPSFDTSNGNNEVDDLPF